MTMDTLLVMMAENDTNAVVIIFPLNFLGSNKPIPVAMVDVEEMVEVAMVVVEAMVTTEVASMLTVEIESMIDLMVIINLRPLGNIFTLLMKIQSLRLLVQHTSFSKSSFALLWTMLSFIIAPTLPHAPKSDLTQSQ